MQITLSIDRKSATSLQIQIFDGMRELILCGTLKPGVLVPSSRALALELRISRNTVINAYERLMNEGYLKARPAGHTYVNDEIPHDMHFNKMLPAKVVGEQIDPSFQPPTVTFHGPELKVVTRNASKIKIDFWATRSNPESFPIKIWRRSVGKVIWRAANALTEYGDPSGLRQLREAIAEHLGPARGFRPDPDQIIIVHGVQEGLNIIARLFIREGTRVATESPCFQGATSVFEIYGAKLDPVPVDENGIQVERLFNTPARLVYLTPSHQFPTGYSLSLKRRLQIIEWAGEVGAILIEDDYNGDFSHEGSPIMALAGLDKCGSVMYLGTFSKSLGPGLRIGYMVVPKFLIDRAIAIKRLLDTGNSWLDQAVLADFMQNGSYTQHLRRVRQNYRSRRDCLVDSLRSQFGDVHLSGLSGGMHLMWHLPSTFPNAAVLEQMARARGVAVYSLGSAPVRDFGYGPYSERALILGYSSLNERGISEGIRIIAEIIQSLNGTACADAV